MAEETDVGMKCIKYMLFVANFMFVMIGFLLISIGSTIKAIYGDFEAFMSGHYFSPANLTVTIGVIIFFVALFGCVGAIKESTCLINLFALLLSILLILEVAAAIAAYSMRSKIEVTIRGNMKASMKWYNDSPYDQEAWNFTQDRLQCCGIDSFNDWVIYGGVKPKKEKIAITEEVEVKKLSLKDGSKSDDSTTDDSKKDDPKNDDSKKDDSKNDDSKKDDSKNDDSKKDDSKNDDSKKDDSKNDDSKKDDSKNDDSKKDDSKNDDSKKDDSKNDDSKKDDSKNDDSKKDDSKNDDSKNNSSTLPPKTPAPIWKGPTSCCHRSSRFNGQCYEKDVYRQGCLEDLTYIVSESALLLGCGALAVAFIQLLGIVFAHMLAKAVRNLKTQVLVERDQIRQKNYEQMGAEFNYNPTPVMYTPTWSEA